MFTLILKKILLMFNLIIANYYLRYTSTLLYSYHLATAYLQPL
nr:MAG TPA: hypothetical protein [Caudoviricetes sp.]